LRCWGGTQDPARARQALQFLSSDTSDGRNWAPSPSHPPPTSLADSMWRTHENTRVHSYTWGGWGG
jgi:hypothetical protein